MMSLFDVTEADIERLNPAEFTDVMNRLLKAEAARYGIPPLAINATLHINDSDAGIDALVDHSCNIPDECRIPPGLSGWQSA